MDYIENISNGLTITGQNITHFEETLKSNINNAYFFPLVKSYLDDAIHKLQASPDRSNHLISLIFDIDSYQELQFAQVQAFLDEEDRGLKNKFRNFEDLIDSAYLLVIFDRLVTSLTQNNLWAMTSVMADLFVISSHNLYEKYNEKSIGKNNRKAGIAANAENRALKRQFLTWYRSNKDRYIRKAEAAREGMTIVPITFRVIERWIREYEMLIAEIGEEEYWGD